MKFPVKLTCFYSKQIREMESILLLTNIQCNASWMVFLSQSHHNFFWALALITKWQSADGGVGIACPIELIISGIIGYAFCRTNICKDMWYCWKRNRVLMIIQMFTVLFLVPIAQSKCIVISIFEIKSMGEQNILIKSTVPG